MRGKVQPRSHRALGWNHQNLISGIRRRAATTALAWAVVLVPGVVATPSAQAQAFEILYRFTGGADGAGPNGLIRDAAGNLYGTTGGGGAYGQGTVFKLDTSGAETVLYSFAGAPDGANPTAALIRDAAGNLYGTTYGGGASGAGTVFKLDTTGTETVLYSFTGGPDGSNPSARLVRDSAGNLYGTTYGGGAYSLGTAFKLDTTGTQTVLHSFAGAPDGANPSAALIRDMAGNLYGTTSGGGRTGLGTVFKLDTTGTETVLHTFSGYPSDGAKPRGALIRDTAGNLYGTTNGGGASGGGTVFMLDTTGTDTVLYSFCFGSGCGTGFHLYAGLLRDAAGNLYGTTYGASPTGPNFGSAFKLDTTSMVTVLHSFTGGDGANPNAALIRDGEGNLYGTTSSGGGGGCAYGCGTVFRLKPL